MILRLFLVLLCSYTAAALCMDDELAKLTTKTTVINEVLPVIQRYSMHHPSTPSHSI